MGERSAAPNQRPPKVLAVIPKGPNWAAALYNRQMESMSDLGCTVELFFLKSRTNVPELFRERRRLRRRIHEFGPDLIHAHFGTMTAFFTVTATSLPVVISFRGSDLNPSGPDDGKLRLAFGHLLSHLSSLRASQIICVSEEVKSRLWANKRRATVIPTGVKVDLFRPIPQQMARKRLGWNSEERVVLFSAGLTDKNKGGELVRKAVDVARSLASSVQLEMMDGHTEPNDVPWLMNAADCLAFASLHEGSPNVVKEAIACNLPVVTVDVGDVRDRLANVEPTAIVPRDPDAMGKALAEILKNPKRSNGHEMIRSVSRETVAAKILEVYRKCLSGRESTGLNNDRDSQHPERHRQEPR